MSHYTTRLTATLENASVSYQLKEALQTFHHHDPVDALRDARALVALCAARIAEIRQTR